MKLDLHPQTVLIVDDEITNIKVLTALLSSELDILFATNGRSALDIARSKMPDLVLLDIMMPEQDGYEVCRKLKSDPQTEHIPVIFVTAKDQEQDEAEGFEAGAIDFITKPFSPSIVKARIFNHLELIGQRNALKVMSEKLERYHERVDRELQTARETQAFLLPNSSILKNLYETHKIYVDSHFEPCSELGGDYWGIKGLEHDQVAVLIADFSGHGVNAALNTFRLHALLDYSPEIAYDPAAFLENLNARLSSLLPAGQYATAFYGVIDPSKNLLRYSSAATPNPFVIIPGHKEPKIGNGSGFPLGMFDHSSYENRELPFPIDAALFLYSDAVTEGKLTTGERLEEAGLIKLITDQIVNLDTNLRLNNLIYKLNEQFVHPLTDDLTVIYIHRDTR